MIALKVKRYMDHESEPRGNGYMDHESETRGNGYMDHESEPRGKDRTTSQRLAVTGIWTTSRSLAVR